MGKHADPLFADAPVFPDCIGFFDRLFPDK